MPIKNRYTCYLALIHITQRILPTRVVGSRVGFRFFPKHSEAKFVPNLLQLLEDNNHKYIMEVGGGRELHSPYATLSHSDRVLDVMNKHRKDCLKLCDVVLKIGDEHIPTHRAVLAACSSYFYAMFTSDLVESRQKVITMKDIDATVVQILVEFAYTGKVDVSVENVQSILATACLIQFHEVRDICCQFLETQLDPSNCLGIRKFTEAHGCTNFLEVVDNFVLENFREVMKSEEYALLPCELLIKVISSDDLNVIAEEEVYEAVMSWVKHDLNNRVKQLPGLIRFVRMPLISKHYLLNRIDADNLIRSNLACRDLLDEAKNYHLVPEQRAQFRTDRMKPRKSMMGTLYAVGGKEAGETISNTVECYRFVFSVVLTSTNCPCMFTFTRYSANILFTPLSNFTNVNLYL